MKTKITLIGIAVFFYTFFHISIAQADTPPAIVLSEIQISGTKADDEFIRLKNKTAAAIDLAGFRLAKKSLSGGVCKESSLVSTGHFQGVIQPDGFFLISHPKYKGFYAADLDYSGASYYLSENIAVILYDKAGELLDRKAIGNACDVPVPPADPPTTPPISDPPATPEETQPSTIRLNEIFPNPKAKGDAGEFVELYNFGAESADISGWVLRDATKTGKYVFPSATVITAGAYLAVTDRSFKLSLNNSNETISLFDNADALIDSVRYEKTRDDVSLNYTATGWRGGAPTPGTVNRINTLPETKERVPKKGYKKVPVAFSAKGKDGDGDTLKYTWNFGDGHKSYKAETSHTYEENGTYVITLTTTDGVEDTIETFAIEIRSYKPPEIRIVSLVPNPAGSDTDNEWIIIENREKKSVNLKGFGIATGWKNLVNHPVREDFLIEPKQKRKMTRAESLFTLPNQKGRLELRAPDGKVLQKIRYKLEKSAAEDSVYSKERGKPWEWQAEQITEGDQQATEVSALPDTLETDQENALPEADSLPTEEAGDSEKEVLGAKVSRPENYDAYLRLLGTGTDVEVPDNITLAFDEISDEAAEFPPQEHYAVSFAKESLSLFNAALNDLFASVR